MSLREFERVVAEALDGLPQEVAAHLENVAVVVEDEPEADDLREVGLDPETETLFGLYQGVALIDRGADYGLVLPDRIVIYRIPLLEACHYRAELIHEIRDTVVHEVGHYFGLPEEELP
jgi:predicted Zn-dependent protease with MMP-like domain